MSLSDDEKNRILEEERARASAKAQAEAEVQKKQSSKKARNALIAFLVVGGCVYAVGKGGETGRSAQPGSIQQEQQAAEKAIATTASKLVADYKANEVAADEKYKNRLLVVTGSVASIGKDIMDNPYVTLSSGEQYDFRSVQCTFDDDHIAKASKLKKGMKISVTGTCKGLMGNVHIKEATF